MDIRNIDIEKVAKAVELDTEQTLPGLRESLAQAKRGEFAAVHTPEMIAEYRATGAALRAASSKRPSKPSPCATALTYWKPSRQRARAGRHA
jgi:hypothetical protein